MKLPFKLTLLSVLLFNIGLFAQNDLEVRANEVFLMPNDTNKVLAWINLSKDAMRQNYTAAISYADSALELSLELEYKKGEFAAKRKKSDGLNYSGKYEESLKYARETYAYYKSIGDKLNASRLMSNMALIRRNQSQFEEAMNYYYEALSLKEEINDSSGIAYVLNNIAITFAIQNQHESAIPYFYKARNIYKKLGNDNRFYASTLDVGGLNLETGNLDSALYYVQMATDYFEKVDSKMSLGRCYYLLGRIYNASEQYDKSEVVLQKTVNLFQELGSTNRVAGAMLRQSELAELQGNINAAIGFCNQALETVKDIEAPNLRTRAYLQLYKLYKVEGKFQEALMYKELHDSVQADVNNKSNQAAIAELEKKYENEQKERLLAELKTQNQEAEIKAKRQWLQQLVLIAVLVIIIILAVAFYNRAQAKKANNEVLRAKNEIIEKALKDKEYLFREVHHRVKNNLQFISSLLNLQSRHITDPKALGILNDARNRVKSMALVHQKLYQEEDLSGVDMKDYMSNLVNSLVHSLHVDESRVSIDLEVDKINLDIDTAIPIGIIFNELITNSFKYAFEKDQGELKVYFTRSESKYLLLVSDNGPGVKLENENETFGTQLIDSMVDKLKASMKKESKNGHSVQITIPNER